MEEKIEKPVNASLDEFMGKENEVGAPAPVVEQTPTAPVAPVAPVAQPVVAPVEQAPMVDPSKIKLGKGVEGDGTFNVLSVDDIEEIQFGDKKLKVSKKTYVIKNVSKQDELAVKKIVAADFTTSRDGQSQWVQTRLEITFEDSDYKSSLPNIKWFQDKYDKDTYNPSFKKIKTEKEFANTFTSCVSKLYYKYCSQFKETAGTFGIEQFFEALVGKKVQLVESEIDFDGKTYRRLDIHVFK